MMANISCLEAMTTKIIDSIALLESIVQRSNRFMLQKKKPFRTDDMETRWLPSGKV